MDGTIGNLRSAPLRPDGTFDADGVAIGTIAIRLVNARIEAAHLRRLFSAFTSPIRRRIPENPSAPLNIDLLEEAIQFQQERQPGHGRCASATGEGP